MKHPVVILAVEPRAGPTQNTIGPIDQEAETVYVGKDATPRNQGLVSPSEAEHICSRPGREKVRDGTHRSLKRPNCLSGANPYKIRTIFIIRSLATRRATSHSF